MKTKLIGLIIFVLLFTTIMPNFIYATDTKLEVNTSTYGEVEKNYTESGFNALKDEGKAEVKSAAGNRTKKLGQTTSSGSALGVALAVIITLPVMIASVTVTVITRGVEGMFFNGGKIINWFTIEDTVFNRIELFDADYFATITNGNSFNIAIKNSVAVFYYITRIIAVVCGLLMLIYLGIRMAASTIASEQAKYKEMLKDWLVSMILIFIMPYIMALINFMANGLVQIFASFAQQSFEQDLIYQILNVMDRATGWSYVAVVCMYIVMTIYQIKFFLMYVQRLLAMGFLIVISPLITITYSATKTPISGKSGKAAMFDRWFKEYTINAFIQPVHAATYMVFVVSAYEIFNVAPFLAVIFFMGLSRSEKIVKNIFGMRKMSSIHSMSEHMKIGKK